MVTTNMNGTVKWFDAEKGFGFINADEGGEVFVHVTGIPAAAKSQRVLHENQRVEYDLRQTERGARAINVKPCKVEPRGKLW